MNENERALVSAVCGNDMARARRAAEALLRNSTAKRDAEFVARRLEELARRPELPYKVKGLLQVEDAEAAFRPQRCRLTEGQAELVEQVARRYKASGVLADVGIRRPTSVILYGPPGMGKTTLARCMAHRLGLPLLTASFSQVVCSLLGDTQKNVARIFEYAAQEPCVLFLDELDAIGVRRGVAGEVGEMSRIVVSLMQCIDAMPAGAVLVAATNRMDILDEALVRRFSMAREVAEASLEGIARAFMDDVGFPHDDGAAADLAARCATPAALLDALVERLVEAIDAGVWMPAGGGTGG